MNDHLPTRILHTMLRVTDLEASLNFYCGALGMKELRREVYESGGFTLSFIGYGHEDENTVLELTYNHAPEPYAHGNFFGHIAVEVRDIDTTFRRLVEHGVKTVREPGPMMHANQHGTRDVIAFVEDPDGIRVELIAA